MENEIKDILLGIQANIIKLQEGQNELRDDVSEIKQDVNALKQGQARLEQDVKVLKQNFKEMKQDIDVMKQDIDVMKKDIKVLDQKQHEIVYDIVIPLRNIQNEINDKLKQNFEEIKQELRSISSKNYVQRVI